MRWPPPRVSCESRGCVATLFTLPDSDDAGQAESGLKFDWRRGWEMRLAGDFGCSVGDRNEALVDARRSGLEASTDR